MATPLTMGRRSAGERGARVARIGARAWLDALPLLLIVLICTWAFWRGVRAVNTAEWPFDVDLYRDIGSAQAMREGRFFDDPNYLGERRWYNPLVPGIVAALSWLTGQPVHLVATRAGAYLNLLAPVCFALLVGRLFGRWTAVASTIGFIFVVPGGLMSWNAATYSPWLFTQNFAQALCYLTLIVYHRALTQGRDRWYVASGVLLGLTFLAHTAPALLIGAIVATVTCADLWRVRRLRSRGQRARYGRVLGNASLVALPALMLSLPLAFTVIGHYGLRVQNPVPFQYFDRVLRVGTAGAFAREQLIALPTALAVVGLAGVVALHVSRVRRLLLGAWLAACAFAIGYNYLWQYLDGRYGYKAPLPVPTFHFLFYLKALQAMLFGYGSVLLAELLASAVKRWFPPGWRGLAGAVRVGGAVELLGFALVGALPAYRERYEYRGALAEAERIGAHYVVPPAFAWVRANVGPGDVVLATDKHARYLIGPAGRAFVATEPTFSNPYVDWASRARDRDALFTHVYFGRRDEFYRLAGRYGVTYVVAEPRAFIAEVDRQSAGFVEKVADYGNMAIYRVR